MINKYLDLPWAIFFLLCAFLVSKNAGDGQETPSMDKKSPHT